MIRAGVLSPSRCAPTGRRNKCEKSSSPLWPSPLSPRWDSRKRRYTAIRRSRENGFCGLSSAHGVLAAALLLAAAAAAWKLAARRRRRVFGSSLSLNLAGWFALMAAAPALLLYGVAAQGIFAASNRGSTRRSASISKKESISAAACSGAKSIASIRSRAISPPRPAASILLFGSTICASRHQLESIVVYDSHGIALAASPGGGGAPSLRPPQLAAAGFGARIPRRGQGRIGRAPGRRCFAVGARGRRQHRARGIDLAASRRRRVGRAGNGDREYRKLLALRRGLNLSFLIALTLAFATVLAAGFGPL